MNDLDVRLHIRFTQQEVDALAEAAKAKGTSISAIVRDLIRRNYLPN